MSGPRANTPALRGLRAMPLSVVSFTGALHAFVPCVDLVECCCRCGYSLDSVRHTPHGTYYAWTPNGWASGTT